MPCPFRSIISINIGMVALKNGGTEAQKAEWLPRARRRNRQLGLTEPGSGSDSAAMQTMAVPATAAPNGTGARSQCPFARSR